MTRPSTPLLSSVPSLLVLLAATSAITACSDDAATGQVRVEDGSNNGASSNNGPNNGDPTNNGGTNNGGTNNGVDTNNGAVEGCAPDHCEIDGDCIENETPNPDNPCELCLVIADREAWTPNDAASCDDGDACTEDDACVGGECVGEAKVCNDGNPCTDDLCDSATGECGGVENTARCDDGDRCTVGDRCVGGACVAGNDPLDCDDGNPCTAATCDPALGCVAEPVDGGACEDGDVCTENDTCAGGRCVGGQRRSCDDSDVCTVDACDPVEGCTSTSIAHLCQDDNPCTDETCDPEQGCVYPFNTDPCNDGNACTEADTCTGGACLGAPVVLDHSNLCAAVSCDPVTGVAVVFTDLPCDDGNACTVGDQCANGGCVTGATPLDCTDDNICTDNRCDPASGCVIEDNTDPCDDDDVCTLGDTCSGGRCEPGAARLDCDDANDCTADSCHPTQGCQHEVIISLTCRPNIEVAWPPRAATLDGASNVVEVRGNVASGAGPITRFTINGQPIAPAANGDFRWPMQAALGGNILIFEAEDTLGTTRKVVQSFLWSPTYRRPRIDVPKSGMVERGMGIYLSQEVLDDGEHSLPADDFATIFELVMQSFDILALVGTPDRNGEIYLTTVALYDLYLRGITYDDPRVSLTSQPDNLHIDVVIDNFVARMVAKGLIFNYPGRLTADYIDIDADVRLEVVDNDIHVVVVPGSVQVDFVNAEFRFDNGFIQAVLGWIVNSFVPGLVSDIEADFSDALANELGPLLEDALRALALTAEIPFPSLTDPNATIPVTLNTDFHDVQVDTPGITFGMRGGVYSEELTPWSNLGALAREGCGQPPQNLTVPGADAFELVLADDILNQILWAAWLGGFLEFEVPASLLGDVDLSQYGVSEINLTASGMLQPTASDCNADGQLRLLIGDLRIDARVLLYGTPVDATLFVSLETALELSVGEAQIGLAITEIRSADVEVNITDPDLLSLEPIFRGLIEDNLVPGLLQVLGGDTLGGFPLPEIDLSTIAEGLGEGATIRINPQTIQRLDGNTVVGGDLAQ